MANLFPSQIVARLVLLLSLSGISKSETVSYKPGGQWNHPSMQYHNGPLLNGNTTVNLIWYGKFQPRQREIVTDFLNSINKPSKHSKTQPDVVSWWKLIQKYYYSSPILKAAKKKFTISLSLGSQIIDDKYLFGKQLKILQIEQLASKGAQNNAINVVLTSADVRVEGFCSICGKHGIGTGTENRLKSKYAYIWVGNSETQCPGQCAWPFYQPMFGPRTQTLVSPNHDVGMDGVIINLSTQLAATLTNPFGNGFSMGRNEAPLEAASACQGDFVKGAHRGFSGDLFIDENTGVSYNAQGVDRRKYLLPDIFDPKGSSCVALV